MPDKSTRGKRLVYSPKAYVFIHSRKIAGLSNAADKKNLLNQLGLEFTDKAPSVIDVTNDVIGGAVNRLIDQPSTAIVRLNNPNYKYTGRFNSVFLPMDGITIWLERIAGKPVQVFTGYIDEIPSYQMYPGTIEIRATCTLKRLLYKYFDPGTQAMSDWFIKQNWTFNYQTGLAYNIDAVGNPVGGGEAKPDSGFGDLLFAFMTEPGLCGWDPKSVIISNLPDQMPDSIASVYQTKIGEGQQSYQDSVALFRKLLAMHPNATPSASGGKENDSGAPGVVASKNQIKEIRKEASKLVDNAGRPTRYSTKPSLYEIFLAATAMTKIDNNYSQLDDQSKIDYGSGIFAIPSQVQAGVFSGTSTTYGQLAAATANYGTAVGGTGSGGTPPGSLYVASGPGASGLGLGPNAKPATYRGDISKSIKKFASVYSEIISSQGAGSKSSEERVALTLSLGMGKEQFYAEILQACSSDVNKKIATGLANNHTDSIDSAGPDVLMASEVYSASIDPNDPTSRVTWDALMGNSAQNFEDAATPLFNRTFDRNSISVSQSYQVIAEKNNVSNVTVYDPFLSQKIKMDLSELKYYVTEFGRNSSDADNNNNYSLGGLEIGTLVQVTNPNNGKSLVAMVADKKKTPDNIKKQIAGGYFAASLIGLSDQVISELGIAFDSETKTAGEGIRINKNQTVINIKRLNNPSASVFDGKTIKDGGQYKLKPKTLSKFISDGTVGPGGSGTQKKAFSTINENDINTYNNSYKGKTIDVLADYFFVANDMGLRLAHYGRVGHQKQDNEIFFKTDNDRSSGAIKRYAEWAQNQVGIQVVSYKSNSNLKILKGKDDFPWDGGPNSVHIIVDENAPRPIYNGAPVHLPTPQEQDQNDLNTGATGTQVTFADLARIGMASAFSTIFSFPTDAVEAFMLTGDKALMNDIPVIQGVRQLTSGCMRRFMSLPNGQFIAFYPDEFGKYGRKPYWKLNDIEIENLQFSYNDSELVTHMYVNGAVNNPLNGISLWDKITSLGVFNIRDALSAGIVGSELGEKNSVQAAADMLQTYGARKEVIDDPLIRNPYFEFIYAYNRFLYHWSMFHTARAQITFQPEIMAGGIVAFPEHNINMYAQQVTHSWDYSTGFKTDVLFTCPSTIVPNNGVPQPQEIPFG